MATPSTPTWLVNSFHAVACISADEINKQFAAISGLPTQWSAKTKDWHIDVPAPSTAPAASAVVPAAPALSVPTIGFDSDLKNGVTLSTTVNDGVFVDLTIGTDADGNPAIVTSNTSLNGMVFNLNTSMKNVVHQAGTGQLTVDQDFTVQSLYADLDDPSLLTSISDDSPLQVPLPDDTKVELCTLLMGLYKDPKYKNSYVLGTSKLAVPAVAATAGPFAPRYVQYTTYNGSIPNTLNWNLMMDQTPPDSADDTVGIFSENPLLTGQLGAMILSYGKLIEELILPNALSGYGFAASDWQSDPSAVNCWLNSTATPQLTKCTGSFSSPNNKIYPDPTNSRIRVDFQLDNVQMIGTIVAPTGTSGNAVPNQQGPIGSIYRVTWSGYFTFSLNSQGELVTAYSQDPINVVKQSSGGWEGAMGDILTLGLDELPALWNTAIEQSLNAAASSVTPNLLQTVELPGGAVFTFSGIDWVNEGLRIGLKYS